MITVKILADSINPSGSRLTSFLLTYPRFIHSEFMTHRVFSRNAASSRAIPFKRMMDDVLDEPAMPERWGAEQKGMQSGEQIQDISTAELVWKTLMRHAAEEACDLNAIYKLHKSLCNRLLEPWAHITVIATATDKGLSNFFALRAHPAAQPEFQVLAYRMLDAYLKSEPTHMAWGRWHLPRFSGMDGGPDYGVAWDNGIKIATARCARLSYLTFDGEHSVEKDIELHDRLKESGHWSPFEHCAQATNEDYPVSNFDHISIDSEHHCEPGLSSVEGLSHWKQYRKCFGNENQTNVNLQQILATKPSWITV